MRISELKFEQCMKPGESHFNMHYDASDCLRQIDNREGLDEVRNRLVSEYGDVEVEIRLNGYWYERIVILDAKWQAEHRRYCNAKAEWCSKYGCD